MTGARRTACVTGRAMVFLAVLAGSAGVAQAPAEITGRITDDAGAPLPGTRVSASLHGREHTAVTDAEGRYRLLNLAPGDYLVDAYLAGFERTTSRRVACHAGLATTVDLTLKPACLDESVRVELGLADAIRRATLIARIRIKASDGHARCPTTRTCVCVVHAADVVEVIRAAPGSPSPAAVTFHQDAARQPGDPLADEAAYAPGDEFVAFLTHDAPSGSFVRTNGRFWMFAVRQGRVEFLRDDAPGLANGMSVDGFMRVLEKLAAAIR